MKKVIAGILFLLFMNSTSAYAKGFFFGRKPKRAPILVVKIYTIDDYMKDMEREIKANWAPPQNSFKNKTVVNFQILRDGTIKNPLISETSGDKEFDRAAMLALANTNKVTPPPRNLVGDSMDIYFTFERFSYLVHKDRYDR